MRSGISQSSILGLCVALGTLTAALPLTAHHVLSAEFDEHKPVRLHGVVTRFQWNNPHAFLYIDVTDASGAIANWAVEWASPLELRRSGWSRESFEVGDSVTVEGWPARDGSQMASGRTKQNRCLRGAMRSRRLVGRMVIRDWDSYPGSRATGPTRVRPAWSIARPVRSEWTATAS
jgi:Family of unknown function (DUF6152)